MAASNDDDQEETEVLDSGTVGQVKPLPHWNDPDWQQEANRSTRA